MVSFAQLKWQCHRGTKELDSILENFLFNHYHLLESEKQQLFVELLALSDIQLSHFLLGGQLPESHSLAELVQHIRNNTIF